MMKKLYLVIISLLISLSLATSVFAAGFALTEPGARTNGLGGATVAMGGDASCLFTNPAAMTRLPGVQTQLGAVVLQPKLDITTYGVAPFPPVPGTNSTFEQKTSMENNTHIAPSGYITSQLSDKLWMGVGAFTRFGLATEYAQTWPGRYNAYFSKVTSFEVNPNVAYKVTDKLSLSAGVTAMYFDITLSKKIPGILLGPLASPTDIDQKLTADSIGYGWNAGLHYEALDWMSIGFSYRSTVKQHVEGNANFSGTTPLQGANGFPSNVDGRGTIVLPDEFFLGIAFKPFERLKWEIGGVFYRWSTYDQLKVEFDQPVGAPASQVVTSSKNWKDTWRFQTGVEYKATDWMDIRLSYVYDQTPVPDTTVDFILPDSDRNVFGVGLGFHGKSWNVDASFNYLIFNDRNIAPRTLAQGSKDFVPRSEIRNGDCMLYGLSFGYKF